MIEATHTYTATHTFLPHIWGHTHSGLNAAALYKWIPLCCLLCIVWDSVFYVCVCVFGYSARVRVVIATKDRQRDCETDPRAEWHMTGEWNNRHWHHLDNSPFPSGDTCRPVAVDKRRTEMRRRCCLWLACKISCVHCSFFQDELFWTSFHQMAWKDETQPRGVRPLHRQPRKSSSDTHITNIIKINGTMVDIGMRLVFDFDGLLFWSVFLMK